MITTTTKPGQNGASLALQHYGTIEGLFTLLRDNDLGWDDVPPGTDILVRGRGEIEPAKIRTIVVLGLQMAGAVVKDPIPAEAPDTLLLHGTGSLLLTTNQPLLL